MSEPTSNPTDARPTRIRYVVLPLLAFAAASAYLTRHCLGVANTTMQEELGFNNEQFGYLYGAFSAGYLICQVPGGWLGQKFGTRTVMPVLSVVWSLCTIITAAVSSLGAMIVSRFVFGLAQAGLVPNGAKAVKDWFPVTFRGKASSIITMSMSIGSVITIWLTAHLLDDHGWREIFRTYSLVGIVWAVAFYFIFRTRPQEHRGANEAECKLIAAGEAEKSDATPEPFHWPTAVRQGATWALSGQLLFKAAGYNFYVTFFPAFLEYKYGITKTDAGMLTTWPLIGVIVGSLCGGAVIDGLYKRTNSKRISRCGTSVVALTMAGLFAVASTYTGTAAALVLVISIGAFFSGISIPCPWAASIDMGGKNSALVMGIMNSTGCLAGICISPFIGRLIDHIKATNGNWDIAVWVNAAFYILAALLWLGVNPNTQIGKRPDV